MLDLTVRLLTCHHVEVNLEAVARTRSLVLSSVFKERSHSALDRGLGAVGISLDSFTLAGFGAGISTRLARSP